MYPFERFSEQAKKTLTLAQEEAERSHHSYIGTEHVLLGVMRNPDGVGAKVLNSLGVDIESVRAVLTSVIGRSERILIQQIIPTSRVKKVIELSFEEARRQGSDHVGTEHLLVGLLLEREGIAAHILKDIGVTIERVRVEIEALGAESAGTPHQSYPPVDADRFRDIMSALPAGVVIVTAFADDGTPRGLTVTAFSPVSLEPRLALVCIAKSSNTLPAVQHTNGFTANLLAAGRDSLARRMATKASDKFDGLSWTRSETGAGGPILVDNVAAYAVCTLNYTFPAGDHWILMGTVVDGAHHHGVRPMVYHRRAYLDL